MRITLRNYRCFANSSPAVIDFTDGFVAFIGPNNAGKSTILRSLYELRTFFGELGSIPNFIGGKWSRGTGFLGVADSWELTNDKSPGEFTIEIEVSPEMLSTTSGHPVASFMKFKFTAATNQMELMHLEAHTTKDKRIALERQFDSAVNHAGGHIWKLHNWSSYVDFSAIVEFAKVANGTRYYGPYRNPINEGAGNHFDIPVGTHLVGAWDSWKSGASKQNRLAIGKVEDDVRRILGVRSLQINASADSKTLMTVLDGRPYRLEELGAGIAELIMVLSAALIQKPTMVAIDEPENHLHPALQLDFLSTLGRYCEKGLLFSTHSIGLARAAADHIFAVDSNGSASRVSKYEDHPNVLEFLGSLGFAGLREIGFRKLLLVEGVTEARTMQQFLRKLNRDREFVLFPLGGSQLINVKYEHELSELLRLNVEKIGVLIDSEKSGATEELSADRQSFLAACRRLGFVAHVTERRATENYFTDKSVKAALGNSYSALSPFQALKSSSNGWAKSANWRIAAVMSESEIRDTDIGRFLTSL